MTRTVKRLEFNRKTRAAIIKRANGKCEACEAVVFRRGLCTTHYTRLLKHGDVEYVGTATSANFKWLEQAISAPRKTECVEWPFAKRTNGYGTIFKDGKRTTTNRLVCELAHGPAPQTGMHAAHSCGNRLCVNPGHLSWKTASDNSADKVAHGTAKRGSDIPWAKLDEAAVRNIRLRLARGERGGAIAKEYRVHKATISDIATGKTWRHVT